MKSYLRVLGAFLMVSAALPLYGTPISWSGSIVAIMPPSSTVQNVGLESDTATNAWAERTNYVLLAPLGMDATTPGTYTISSCCTPGTASPGIVVSSYYFHIDPVGSDRVSPLQFSGSVTFDKAVLGIAWMDASLIASNSLGSAGTVYNTSVSNFGLNPGIVGDSVTISADRRTVSFVLNPMNDSDDFRIFTDNVPEPATGLLLVPGLAALAFLRRRRAAQR